MNKRTKGCTPLNSDRLANELNQLTDLYKSLISVSENLRNIGDRDNSLAIQEIAFGLQNCQLNILTSMINDPGRSNNSKRA